VRIPTLILQGRLDTVVEPANATWLYDKLGTAAHDKRLVFMERSEHLLALDRDRDLVIAETLAFLHERAAAPTADDPRPDEP
jgi:carboxylesterase